MNRKRYSPKTAEHKQVHTKPAGSGGRLRPTNKCTQHVLTESWSWHHQKNTKITRLQCHAPVDVVVRVVGGEVLLEVSDVVGARGESQVQQEGARRVGLCPQHSLPLLLRLPHRHLLICWWQLDGGQGLVAGQLPLHRHPRHVQRSQSSAGWALLHSQQLLLTYTCAWQWTVVFMLHVFLTQWTVVAALHLSLTQWMKGSCTADSWCYSVLVSDTWDSCSYAIHVHDKETVVTTPYLCLTRGTVVSMLHMFMTQETVVTTPYLCLTVVPTLHLCLTQQNPRWTTTLMNDQYDEQSLQMNNCLAEQPPWWTTTLTKDYPDKQPPWWKNTLINNHPDEELPW